jgi:hypothetical protein
VPILYSILYPVIAEPPSFAGGFQKTFTWVEDIAVALGLVGTSGAVAANADPNDTIIMIYDNTNSDLFTANQSKRFVIDKHLE